ncbi:MAG: hypothetical protein GWP14_04015 [Actinobacteria bacterium]|nr:hypothetical protein [Actinomycetota bacterium]
MNTQEKPTSTPASADSTPKGSSAIKTVQERTIKIVTAILHWLEVCLAGISIIVVIIGICFLLGELVDFWDNLSHAGLQTTIENVLSDILLLVVGVELAIMLIRRRPEDLVDIIFFVIARKMLIRTGEFYELLIGVVALAGVFAIRKYLVCRPQTSDN